MNRSDVKAFLTGMALGAVLIAVMWFNTWVQS
jgi:hypothetical protein